MRRVLWWPIGGSRGSRNHLWIVWALAETPMNTNQLATELDLDDNTTQHHLILQEENNVLTTRGDGYGKMSFLTDRLEQHLELLGEIAEQAGLEAHVD